MSATPANFTDGVITLTDDGGNSEALLLGMGDFALSGLVPDGRALEVYESRGAVTGARKGARAYPTISFSAQLAGPSADFHLLALGVIAGFISTTADIGDYEACDLDFSFDYGAESRDFTADDVILMGWELKEGSPSTIALSFQILGPCELDGTTIVPSR